MTAVLVEGVPAPDGAPDVLDYARSLNIPVTADGEIGPGVDATRAFTAAISDVTAKINLRNHEMPLRFPPGFYDCITASGGGNPVTGGAALSVPSGLADYLDLYFEGCQFRLNQFADRPAGSVPAAGAVSGATRFIDVGIGGTPYTTWQNLRLRGRALIDAGGFTQYAGLNTSGQAVRRTEHILLGNAPALKFTAFANFRNFINEADLEVFNIPGDGNNQYTYCWLIALGCQQLKGFGVADNAIYAEQNFYRNIRTGHGPGRITARGGMTGVVISGAGINGDQAAGLAWIRNGRVCNVVGDDVFIWNLDHDTQIPQVTANVAAALIQVGQGAVTLNVDVRNIRGRGARADVGIEIDNCVNGICKDADVADCYTAPFLTTNVAAADPNVALSVTDALGGAKSMPRQDMYASEAVFTWNNCKGNALTDWNRTLGGDANSNSMVSGFYAYQYPTNGPAGEIRVEDSEIVRKSPIFPRLAPAAAMTIAGPVRRARVENFRNTVVDFTHASGATVTMKGLVVNASRGHTTLVEVDGWRDEIVGTIDGAGSSIAYTQFALTGNDLTVVLKNIARRRLEITRTNGGGGLTYNEYDWGGLPANWVDGFSATATQSDPSGVLLTTFVTDWFDGSVPGKADLSVAGNQLALTAGFGTEHRMWNAGAGYHADGWHYIKLNIPTGSANGLLARSLLKGVAATTRLTATTTLPADGSPTTLTVQDVSNFSATGGVAYIGPMDNNTPQILPYTGLVGNQLVGVTNYTPSLTLQAGQLVKNIHSWAEASLVYAADGLSANLVLSQIVKGAKTDLATVPITPLPAAGSSVWVRSRFNRGVLYADYFTAAAPTNSTVPVLTTGPQLANAIFGTDKVSVPTLHGLAFASADATASLDDSTLNTFNIIRSLLVDGTEYLSQPVGVTSVKGLIGEIDPGFGPTMPGTTELGRADLRNVDHSRLAGLSGLTVPVSYSDGSSRDKVFLTAYTGTTDQSQPAAQAAPSTTATTLRAPEANTTTKAYYQAGAQREPHVFGAGVAITRSRDATQPKVEQQTWLTAAATLSQTVPTTLNVADTSKFPAAGLGITAATLFVYTGKTATTLTGVLAVAAATPAQFAVVQTLQFSPTNVGQVTYLTAQASLSTTPSTVSVLDTSGFPVSGTFQLAGKTVTYTGKTATSFTGCTIASGTATAQPTDRAFIVSTAYSELVAEPNEWLQISYVAGAFPSLWTKAVARL